MESQESFDIKILSLANGGDGVGRLPDGRAVFIPFSIPGEIVRIRIAAAKKTLARGEIIEVLAPAPQRILPRCKHFEGCGGCQLQHMAYTEQLRNKQEILTDLIQRTGGLKDIYIPEPIPSPQEWNYRNHVQFHIAEDGHLGYQAARSHRIIPVDECHLPDAVISTSWQQIALEPESGIEQVAMRSGMDEDLQIIFESSAMQAPEMELDLACSVLHHSPAGELVLAGDPFTFIEVKDRQFRVSAASFFQVNTKMAELLVDEVLKLLPVAKIQTMLDVYCGVGLFSSFLASRSERLIGIELSEAACNDFAHNLEEFDHVELYQGLAEEILPELKISPDVVLVDPPRSGLEGAVINAICASKPGQIIYVSCDPSTFARDCRSFAEHGYQLRQAQLLDMFPQTFHFETVGFLTPAV